jgi:lysophospholipase L1-like esterase
MPTSGNPSPAAPSEAPRRRILAGLTLLLASTAISLLLAEGLVRMVAPQSLIVIRPDIWMPADQVGWRNRPDVDTRINTGEREVRWRTDAQGFRTGAPPPATAEVTLIALGDSFLAAMQVEDEETMVRILEARLSSRSGKRVRILNTGVAGWGPNQYRNELQRILDTSSADGVLVFVFLGNDIGKAVVASIPAREAEKRHVLRWPRSLDAGELVNAIAYPVNDFLEVRSHLFILARTRLKFLLMRLGLSADYFPSTLMKSEASSTAWSTTADILKEVADRAAARRLHAVFVLLPSPEEADPAQAVATAKGFGIDPASFDTDQARVRLGEEMARRNLDVVDATPALRAAISGRTPDVYGQVDNHLGKAGHRVVAEAMEEAVWNAFFVRPPTRNAAP